MKLISAIMDFVSNLTGSKQETVMADGPSIDNVMPKQEKSLFDVGGLVLRILERVGFVALAIKTAFSTARIFVSSMNHKKATAQSQNPTAKESPNARKLTKLADYMADKRANGVDALDREEWLDLLALEGFDQGEYVRANFIKRYFMRRAFVPGRARKTRR